ncbi:PAS domain-containing protein, partial [Caulobacter sp. 602-1]|uniref:PAS domain-containing protein n=1 Tax=Caulobacter sp. 602-1 TaxID=2492472 RepID=UPI000F63607E
HFGHAGDQPLTLAGIEAAVHPKDMARRAAALNAAIARAEDYDVEYRISWPDGSSHWVQVRGRLNRIRPGEPRRMSGLSIDITARKTAEA